MFERIISVDWSGAGNETRGVDLRIAAFDDRTNKTCIVDRPYHKRAVASWSRQAFSTWLVEQLRDKRPALVAMDFGFGLPWGSDRALFAVNGWRDMIRAISERYLAHPTARAAAQAINDDERFNGHGPYRFNDCRNDFRFYLDREVAYYRLTELIAPQAISQWYLGSGGTVGFHTITGMCMINRLLQERDAGTVDFMVWPHEGFSPDGAKHVLAESYPAICGVPNDYGPCRPEDQHQRDAWKVLQMLLQVRNDGRLPHMFQIKEQRIGRITNVGFAAQVQFEGYILGLT